MLLKSVNSCGVLTQNCLDLIIHHRMNDRHYKFHEDIFHAIYLFYDLTTYCGTSK